MARNTAMNVIVIFTVCFSVLASPALSFMEAIPYLLPTLPECLTALKSVQSCMEEAVLSVLNGQLKVIGPQCCKAFRAFDNKCWPKALPVDPLYTTVIQNFCHSRFKN